MHPNVLPFFQGPSLKSLKEFTIKDGKHTAYYKLPPLETYRHFKVLSYDDVTFYMPFGRYTGSVNNVGTPCRLLPLPPFAVLKRLEHVLFSVKNTSGLYNIERGNGYCLQRCQMSQELLTETA